MSSEKQLCLPEQPKDTCPMIDGALEELKEVQHLMRRFSKIDNLEDAKSMLDEIDTVLFYRGNCIQSLDKDIRQNASAIRNWGQAWKDLAKEQASRIYELEQAQMTAVTPSL